jgi:cullin-4
MNNNSTKFSINIQKQQKNGKQNQKKLVIKNFKTQPKIPENFEEELWKQLKDAIHAVHNQKISQNYEELYKAVENLCYHKMADSLYKNLQEEIEKHIKGQLPKLLQFISEEITCLTSVNNWARSLLSYEGPSSYFFIFR